MGDLSTFPNVVYGWVGGLGLAIMVGEGMLYVACSSEMVWSWTGHSGSNQKKQEEQFGES